MRQLHTWIMILYCWVPQLSICHPKVFFYNNLSSKGWSPHILSHHLVLNNIVVPNYQVVSHNKDMNHTSIYQPVDLGLPINRLFLVRAARNHRWPGLGRRSTATPSSSHVYGPLQSISVLPTSTRRHDTSMKNAARAFFSRVPVARLFAKLG
jgi:hypothetical protein